MNFINSKLCQFHNYSKILNRSYYSSPPNALNILNDMKYEMQKALKNKVFVNKNDDCYECFDIMNKNNIEFVPIKDNNKIIGFLSKNDIKSRLDFHIYMEEETFKIREDLNKLII